MSALKIRRDDEVVVISGKDKGKTGKVLRVDPKKSRVYVEGLNIVKRHQRPNAATGQGGGVVSKEGPIHISNVMDRNRGETSSNLLKVIWLSSS